MRLTLPLVLIAWFATVATAQQVDIYHSALSGSSIEAGLSLGQAGATSWFMHPDSLVGLDFETGKRSMRPIPDVLARFAVDARPSSNSAAVEPGGRWAWVWDGSVGSVYRISLTDSVLKDYSRYSSRTQFKHAGGLDPRTNRPLAFSGYGYYRAKEFLLTFDDSLDTWREIPFIRQPAPAPRLGGVMITGWDSTRIAIVGGTVEVPGEQPPAYSQVADDAWVLDLKTGAWTAVTVPVGFECIVRDTEHRLGFVPVHAKSGTVFLSVADGCPSEFSSPGDVIAWKPAVGTIEILGATSRTLPVDAYFATMYVTAAGDTVRVVFWQPEPGVDIGRWRQWRFGFPMNQVASVDSTTSPWFLVVVLLLGGAWGSAWYFRRGTRARVIQVQIHEPAGSATFTTGDLVNEVLLSRAARTLVAHLAAADSKAGDPIPAEDLMAPFLEDYPDPDSARVIRNRAIDELNAIGKVSLGGELIQRERRVDDARRYDYRLTREIRLG